MNAHVHVVVAQAAVVTITQPKTLGEMATCLGVACIAGTLSDIDSNESKSRKAFNRVVLYLVIACTLLAVAYFKFNYNIFKYGVPVVPIPIVILVGLVCFAYTRPHREYAHSLFFSIPIGVCISMLFGPVIGMAFFVAQESHNCIDHVNKRRVKHLFPLIKRGWSLNLVKADGWVAGICGSIATVVLYVNLYEFSKTLPYVGNLLEYVVRY